MSRLLLPLLLVASSLFAETPKTTVLKTPLAFQPNRGQMPADVRFAARGPGYGVFLLRDEAMLVVHDAEGPHTLGLTWSAAAPAPDIRPESPLPTRVNYISAARTLSGIPTYARVRYAGALPGVDLVFYGNQRRLEFDFVVAPGVDPGQLQLRLTGADGLRLSDDGDLLIQLGSHELRQHKPVAYQQLGGRRVEVSAAYVLRGDRVAFRLGAYDPRLPLIIDPLLSYSTFLGGKDFDGVSAVAVNSSGQAYLAGSTVYGFPTKNAIFGNGVYTDAYVTKLSADGRSLVFSTYISGNARDGARDIALDRFGNVYVAGTTSSTDFPTTPGAFQQTTNGSHETFIAKLNPSGSALVYSTLLGGSGPEAAHGMALDSAHRVYIVGETCSADFPLRSPMQGTRRTDSCTSGSFQGFTAFVTRLESDGANLDYSTYLGGTVEDSAQDVAVDSSHRAYVTGYTRSPDFPTTSGAYQRTRREFGSDAFVARFTSDGGDLSYSTLVGGVSNDFAYAIAVDADNRAYITGMTGSWDYPTTVGAFQRRNHGEDAFVTKLWATGGGLIFSTLLGGSDLDTAADLTLDSSRNVYVVGGTYSSDFPLRDPIQPRLIGSLDAFIAKLSASGKSLLFSTYLGGTSSDSAASIRRDAGGNLYVGGATSSADFPTTPGAFERTKNSGSDGWVAKVSFGTASSTNCPVPSDSSVRICLPATSDVTSPVRILASSNSTAGSIRYMQLWIDGEKVHHADGALLDTTETLASGRHRLVVTAKDSAGNLRKAVMYVNVE